MKSFRSTALCAIAALILFQTGCATHNKNIAASMLVGGIIGAAAGFEFVNHGENRQFQTQDTIISGVLFALLTGGFLAWHYREVEENEIEISGRFSRERLCDPEDLNLAKKMELGGEENDKVAPFSLLPNQVGKLAISLDDNTKWTYPIFRKRFLMPERGETQVISTRYIWEIVKPGSFVTRSQDPQYFIEIGDKKK